MSQIASTAGIGTRLTCGAFGISMQVLRGIRGLIPFSRFHTTTSTTTRWTITGRHDTLSRGSVTSMTRKFASKDVNDVIPEPEASKPGEMPDSFKQATGLERAEIEHPDLFKHNEVLRGGFGTKENPVKIPSAYNARIVVRTAPLSPYEYSIPERA